MMNNNEIVLSGEIIGELEFSHAVKNDEFYKTKIEIKRLSDKSDVLNLTIPKCLADEIHRGQHCTVRGQLRTYNRFFQDKMCLVVTVFVKEIEPCHISVCRNEITLNGFICKEPVYRTTPFQRQICDMLLAVNRGFNKSDYIPCIAWGSNAFFASSLAIGTNVIISGRLQSREYEKQQENGETITKVAYEVSVATIEVMG